MRVWGAALLATLVGAGAIWTPSASAADPPNVVVIMTDDQTAKSLRVMGEVQRRLVERGTTFVNSFVVRSLCCPSRATFLSGQYSHNHGVFGNGDYRKFDHTNTLAVWLQNAGYNTIHVGKYLNGYGGRDPTNIPPGWSDWHALLAGEGGFGSVFRYYDFTLSENGRLVTYERAYQTDLLARKAVKAIETHIPEADPFFLWASFFAPHAGGPPEPDDPSTLATPAAAPRHRNDFTSLRLPRPPGFNERNVSDKPASIRKRPRFSRADLAAIKENYQQRLEALLAVDDAVAAIVSALRRSGELGNTLIVFTSDNGFFHGEHRLRTGKELVYEPSIRVPLILRGPGVPEARRLRQIVANIDLAPTITEATGATPGRVMDGQSLFALMRDPTLRLERDLLIERKPGEGDFNAIRTRRYLYAEHWTGEQELYDLALDPFEVRSVHAESAYDAVKTDLAARLTWLRACAGDMCRIRP